MNTNNVYSFSVPSEDTNKLELITELKKECRNTGKSFSFIVLEGLKLYKEKKECSGG